MAEIIATWKEYKKIKKNKPENMSDEEFREAIKKYEEEKLWPITRDTLKKNWEQLISEEKNVEIRGVILTVGFSSEPIAGTLYAINPDYACLIHTKQSEHVVNTVLRLSEYPVSRIKKFMVEKDKVESLHNKIREAIKHLVVERGIPKEAIALDPTGGTKIMPFVGGIVGLNYNLSLLYVSNHEYDAEVRRPVAGKEYFVFQGHLANNFPLRTYFLAVEMLRNADFHSSLTIWEPVHDRYSNSHVLLRVMAQGLTAWDSFKYEQAIVAFKEVLLIAGKIQSSLTNRSIEIIKSWITYLEQLKDDGSIKAIDFYCHASRKFKNGSYNIAIIMAYVAFETLVEWLCKKNNVSREEFDPTSHPKEFEAMNTILRQMKKEFRPVTGKLGLVEGLALLSSFYPFLNKKHIGKAMAFAEVRNNIVHRGKAPKEEKLATIFNDINELFHEFKEQGAINYEGCHLLNTETLNVITKWLIEASWS